MSIAMGVLPRQLDHDIPPLSAEATAAATTPMIADTLACRTTLAEEEVREASEADWFPRDTLPWWGAIAIRLLQRNPLPAHIAFIMDGNRRYARAQQLATVVDGHSRGFEQLTRVLEWCSRLGVREITVYAFSLENFHRSEDEVSGLMEMAVEKFERLLQRPKALREKQICFRFFGNHAKLPARLRRAMDELQAATRDYTRAYLNVCLAYTSQDEIVRAMRMVHADVRAGALEPSEIDETVFERALDTRDSLPVDMLVRTSGEHRLSDFLLWQCTESYVYFDNVMWPDFGFWNLFKAIFNYQVHSSRRRTRSYSNY